MRILVIGASSGLGKAFVEGLTASGHEVIGVSRSVPVWCNGRWIAVDFSEPKVAVAALEDALPGPLDVLIWNLGIWEPTAFSDEYRFEEQDDSAVEEMLAVNVTGLIVAAKAIVPKLLGSGAPKVIITGSTSGLPRSGRPEVTFGATKAALNGVADALREGYRDQRLAVTVLQLGNLNTEDALDTPRVTAAARGEGELIPLHDVVDVVKVLLENSSSSFVRELIMPAIADKRF
ncbi:SDR family NAD(P)-dependent oxidoreductase [Leucobacter sp. UT-8R-CII-1-4]|uniref:SDR family NAD(P)-dependent oxidoreductase n=1 Tax=Leucobacter sp. UT-8R-CII-1-4 TaxID=3040075 RepID=UPI0024A84262|nr:SDR family NAD(P)-dependent oxidoreductase [Leucobacter sp. UT-8R-CII-1-4]MDI6024429.1 SDR family NAD(P)-dependent oxidoreductase [Leucobacter sp. UT-8R-CII-1-4]